MRPAFRIALAVVAVALFVIAMTMTCGAPAPDPGQGDISGDPASGSSALPARLDVSDPLDTLRIDREVLERQEGDATYYADLFQGRTTASGERFDQSQMVAAHPSYPFGTRLRVSNPANDRAVEVRVVDRGPFAGAGKVPAVIDLSREAARRLGILRQGRAAVVVEVLEWGDGRRVG